MWGLPITDYNKKRNFNPEIKFIEPISVKLNFALSYLKQVGVGR
jgi:hypothetical protein